jgi:hypothetical protein
MAKVARERTAAIVNFILADGSIGRIVSSLLVVSWYRKKRLCVK